MTRLFNDPTHFADEMVEGFVAAHGRWVRRVAGGVARRTAVRRGQVALVIGGGSGHYPAFAGLVGPGLAAGAVLGNVFASPSAAQVVSVAKATENGGGVLLSYGNYAGDYLNFSQAEEWLRSEGIACRSVLVTDDIFSAPADQRHKRRGIAGDLAVFKVAGAAAAEGRSLDDVAAVAQRANDRTRSLGVAFSGCTLPGASEPLFTVPEGRMAIGLGIHGEPGLAEADVPTAAGLADLLVERLLEELPDGVAEPAGQRVVALLNGLGTVKHEELFVTYGRVHRRLEQAGITVVEPEVGEFCTSFDMAGVSLTLLWLDEELEALWAAPAHAPAFHKGELALPSPGETVPQPDAVAEPVATVATGTPESREAAAKLVEVFQVISQTMDDHVDELGRIDSVAGDGDHGIGMQRGARAAAEAARSAYEAGAGAGTLLIRAAEAWADRAGGTSGALWGLGLRRIGLRFGDEQAPTADAVAEAVHAARVGISEFGKAEVGDKTMVDTLVPFDDELSSRLRGGDHLVSAWLNAAAEAERAAQDTSQLLPRMGRARPHAEKSLGTPDAGAVSLGLIVSAVGDLLQRSATHSANAQSAP
jgi:D-erythrulose 4-kinase